jgi:hypothetical protein
MVAAWWMAYRSLSRRMDFSVYLGRLKQGGTGEGTSPQHQSIKPKKGRRRGGGRSHVGVMCAVNVNVNVFSLGLSNATEEQQVYSAIWDMPQWWA